MSSRGSHSRAARRARTVVSAAALLGSLIPATQAQTVVAPHLGAAVGWTDNIALVPPDASRDAEIWQLLPGISVKHDSQGLHGTLDYDLQEYWYGGGEHGRSTFQNGKLFADAQVAPDWLYLDLGGAITQSVVDPAATPTLNALFPTGNLVNESAGSATPILRHSFGAVQLLAQYGWGFVHYQPVGTVTQTLPNASNQDGNFKLSNADPHATLTWDAGYVRQQTNYRDSIAPRWLYESATANAAWLVSPAVRLIGQGGKESDPRQIGAGGLESTLWSAGFDWTPDTLNEVRFSAGRRFYGNSYDGLVKHQSRLFTLQASYSEMPTTSANRLQPQAPPQDLVTVPGVPALQRVTPDVFVLKALDARAGLTGRLTEVGVNLSYWEQNYLTANGVPATTPIADQFRAVTLYMTRRMGAQLQGVLNASFSHNDLREAGDFRYNDQHYTARLDDQVGSRTTVSLTYDHWQRSGSQIFKVNMVTLKANMTFGNGPTGLPNNPIVPNTIPVTPPTQASLAPAFIMSGAMEPVQSASSAMRPADAAFPAAP